MPRCPPRLPHSSIPHHAALDSALPRASETQARVRGIHRFFNPRTAANTPEPIITLPDSDLWLEFPFSEAHLRAVEMSSSNSVSGLDEKLGDGLDEELDERRATTPRAMAKNPSITVSDLSNLLGISRNATDKSTQFLKDKGWIKRIGPAKGGHWEVTDQALRAHTLPAPN